MPSLKGKLAFRRPLTSVRVSLAAPSARARPSPHAARVGARREARRRLNLDFTVPIPTEPRPFRKRRLQTDAAPRDSRRTIHRTEQPRQPRASASASRRRGAVAARVASGSAPGDARLAALLEAIEEAKALSARRAADDDDTIDASALAARLEEAERENDELREKVAELTALNDDAAAELLEDAAELAAALARAEDLEEEAEALRVLNARLAEAAEEVAAIVVADDASSSSTETHLEKLRAEADTAKTALATAEHRAKVERDALLSRVRALEMDLAEAEAEDPSGEDTPAASPDALASARDKIEGLSALAAQRGDALLQAEAAAAAAAAEVSSLKKRLASAEESAAGASADAKLLATIRALETEMATMLTEEEATARVRELELAMAEMVDAEEMDALLAHARAVETRMADMVDAEALAAAETRAEALRVEAETLRARVRALETEMASMTHDDEAGPVTAEDAARGATVAAVSAFLAAPAKAPSSGRETPFARDPKATFKKRALAFAAKTANAAARPFERAAPETFALRRRTFPATTRAPAAMRASASRSAGRVAGDAVMFAFGDGDGDATKRTSSKPFERASPDAFILRKFDFPATRARASSVARDPPFSRADGGAYVKRRLTFFDAAERQTLAVEGSASMPVGAFTRTPGAFKLRRFDFVKAEGVRGGRGANANERTPRRAFQRAPAGGFSLRRFKFHP